MQIHGSVSAQGRTYVIAVVVLCTEDVSDGSRGCSDAFTVIIFKCSGIGCCKGCPLHIYIQYIATDQRKGCVKLFRLPSPWIYQCLEWTHDTTHVVYGCGR